MKSRRSFAFALAIATAALALTACVNVSKNGSGDNVDVKTPFGSVSVRTDQVKPEETGLNVYPGSKLVPKHGHDIKPLTLKSAGHGAYQAATPLVMPGPAQS